MASLAFGSFVLDLDREVLLRDGVQVPIGHRGFVLLRVLLEAHGEVVSKEALIDAAWPSLSVEESNLTVQIAALRRSLGTLDGGEDWIRTVPRVGYRLVVPRAEDATPGTSPAGTRPEITAGPSIAVLPFRSMSSDPEHDYFAEGLSADLITDLSKVPGMVVIARNSSFAYRGRGVDLRRVAEELGVRYIVDGSVRRSEARIRVNAEFIDAASNAHVWADRFDRDAADIFAVQDEIADRVVHALAAALPPADRPARRRTANLAAYDLFARGRALMFESLAGNRSARPLLLRALEIDPDFAEAYSCLAVNHVTAWAFWAEPAGVHKPAALEAAKRAVALDFENAQAHANLAYVEMFNSRTDVADAELATALRIDPNLADAWIYSGEFKTHRGDASGAVEDIETAFRLNPYPPGWYYWILGYAQYAMRKYEEAVDSLSHPSTRRSGSQRLLAASLAQLGRTEEARAEAQQFLAANPDFSMDDWAAAQPFRDDAERQHYIEGYLKAGMRR